MRIVQQSEWGSSGKDEQMVRMTRQRLQEILLYLRTTLIMSCSPAIPAQPASCGIFKVYFPKRRKDKLNESDPSFMLSYGENDEIKYYEDLFNLFFSCQHIRSKYLFLKLNWIIMLQNHAESGSRLSTKSYMTMCSAWFWIYEGWELENSSGCNWICKHPLSYLNYISFNFYSTHPFPIHTSHSAFLLISFRVSLFIHILAFLAQTTRIQRGAMNAKGLYDKDNKE